MRLQDLRVIHVSKIAAQESGLELASIDLGTMAPQAFLLQSCQRWLWVGSESTFDPRDFSGLKCAKHYEGEEAYLFLLRVATGLESQVVGETDIFGQLKEAWLKSASCHEKLRSELSPWMQRLFEDTKEIRSRHLQNLGGASYGTLVRRIIRDRSKVEPGPTLVIGAGQIARSVAPFLTDHELWLWNRGKENLERLKQELKKLCPHANVRFLSDNEMASAWAVAQHVVICVPTDDARDARHLAAWKSNPAGRSIIHLGGYRHQAPSFAGLPEFFALDQIFELQRAQGDVRSTQIHRARRACEERAKLRAMGSSVTLPHGWEDLAAFA